MDKSSQIANTAELQGVYRKNDEFESAQIGVRSVKRGKARTRRVHEHNESIELRELPCSSNQDTPESRETDSFHHHQVNPDESINQDSPILKNGSSKDLFQTHENSNQPINKTPLSADHNETGPEVGNSSLQELHNYNSSDHIEVISTPTEPSLLNLQHLNETLSQGSLLKCCSHGISLVRVTSLGDIREFDTCIRRFTVPSLEFEGSSQQIEPLSLQPLEENELQLPRSDQQASWKRLSGKIQEPGLVQQCTYSLDEYPLQHVNPSNGSVHLRLQAKIFDQGTSGVREPIVIDLPEYNTTDQHCPCCSNAEELVQNGNQYSNEPTQLRHFVEVIQQETFVVGERSLQDSDESCNHPQCSANGEGTIQQTCLYSSRTFQLKPFLRIIEQGSTCARKASLQELFEPQCSLNSTNGETSSNHNDQLTRRLPKSIEAIQLRPLPTIEDEEVPRSTVLTLRAAQDSNRSTRKCSHRSPYGEGPSSQIDLPSRHVQSNGSIQLRPLPPIHENGPTHISYTGNSTQRELPSRTNILPADDSRSSKCHCALFCTAFVIMLTFVVFTISVYAYFKFRSYFINLLDTSTDSPDKSKTSSPSSFYCKKSYEYHHNDWFIPTTYRQGYECETLAVIDVVKIQRLAINGQSCDSIMNCTNLIEVYLDIVNLYGKYHFYVDNQTNVYKGRSWSCPYITGQLWVAAMVEDFSTSTKNTERERIFSHFTNDVLSYGRSCGYVSDNVMTLYLNSSST